MIIKEVSKLHINLAIGSKINDLEKTGCDHLLHNSYNDDTCHFVFLQKKRK